jgi:prepilin-type N-terminal cleavage/methylation domain-containing protein
MKFTAQSKLFISTNGFNKRANGFTLVELLIVITLIGILAAVTMTVMNSKRHLGESRNTRRRLDLNTLSLGMSEYYIDKGILPTTITDQPKEICRKDAADCNGLADLSDLTTNSRYLTSIPIDPLVENVNSTGYTIYLNSNGRVVINAPLAENGADISVTR